MRADSLKGHLELLLLAILEDAPRHGYAVIEELRHRSGDAFDLPEGTVYPALHRLERAGLLASSWADVGGRRRRVYRVTNKGSDALGHKRVEWATFAKAVQRVVRPWPSTS